jgi:hypothetical protein
MATLGDEIKYSTGTNSPVPIRLLNGITAKPYDLSPSTTKIEFAVTNTSREFYLSSDDPTQIEKMSPATDGVVIVHIPPYTPAVPLPLTMRYALQVTENAGLPNEEKQLVEEGDFVVFSSAFN